MSNKREKLIAPLTSKNGIVKKEGKHKKMAPFAKNQERKWVINSSKETPHSMKNQKKKEEMRNANRSLKKGIRQQLKRDLENQIDEYFED
jgi:hypothetical protein